MQSLARLFLKRLALVGGFALTLAGCGVSVGATGHDVGGQCTANTQCASLCSPEPDFGSGMCTRTCATDRDCPSGAVCVNSNGGICAVSCRATADCSGFGRAFICADKANASGGPVLVCRLP